MALLLQYTLIYASVLMLVALGGCFSERSGVINLGLEGTMVIGALGGALVMKYMGDLPAALMILTVVLGSVIFGMIYSLLLAVSAINFKADQTLVGTAMNLLGTAAATVIVKAINMGENVNNVSVQMGNSVSTTLTLAGKKVNAHNATNPASPMTIRFTFAGHSNQSSQSSSTRQSSATTQSSTNNVNNQTQQNQQNKNTQNGQTTQNNTQNTQNTQGQTNTTQNNGGQSNR